jgi:hypothetical protein
VEQKVVVAFRAAGCILNWNLARQNGFFLIKQAPSCLFYDYFIDVRPK